MIDWFSWIILICEIHGEYRTAGHLVFWKPWPVTGHIAKAFKSTCSPDSELTQQDGREGKEGGKPCVTSVTIILFVIISRQTLLSFKQMFLQRPENINFKWGSRYNTKALPQPSLRYREASAEERDTPGGGGHLGIFWVDMCRPGLQIGTPF